MAATVVGAAIVLLFSLWGLGGLYLRGMESQAWAEGRCLHVYPANQVSSKEWVDCIEAELAKGAFELVWPHAIGAAVGLGVVVLARRMRLERPVGPP